ncbi:HPr kinase/phosphorylase [Nitratireductor luteus]|uniref:HPr kinase/phosphorylase n=1 Tax=Nitratireductor luteus TaxID=2976980 RepID=UPI00223FE0C6|nr:HPr kinase/phosphorylase [Nitratireductor luteus]
MAAQNHHGVLLVLGRNGVFILGPSGSGKTRLMLTLLSHCRALGIFARQVSDDQVLLERKGDRLIGTSPAAIAGLAEAYGHGPAAIGHEPRAVIDLVIRLVEPVEAPRFAEEDAVRIESVDLPCLVLAAGDAAGANLAICARLGLPPFG